ncbi:hypothetical protein [Microbispora rosea]
MRVFVTGGTGPGEVHHGAVLLAHGLFPELAPGDYASALIHLIRE